MYYIYFAGNNIVTRKSRKILDKFKCKLFHKANNIVISKRGKMNMV